MMKRARSGRTPAAPRHPGAVLAEILEDTPRALAAKWFGVAPAELEALLEGRAPMTPDVARTAGAVFGTGSAPWLEMQAAWDAARAKAERADASKD